MCNFIYSSLTSPTVIGWLTILAELSIAYVIYIELEEARRIGFVERTTEASANRERAEIYGEYLALLQGSDLEKASQAFVEKMYKEPDLKGKCDRQIAHFNAIGIATDRWLPSQEKIVGIFPHAAIFMWIILQPYITQRRDDSGKWFASPLLKFTLASAKFIARHNTDQTPLRLRHPDGRLGLTITPVQIRQVTANLERTLRG